MANGVLKSQAEYYGDTETYTGDAGSETNMYVIEDVFDLCTEIDKSHFEIVSDIDFNDHPTHRYGVSNIIFGSKGYNCYNLSLHGNGHKIRNLLVKNSSALMIFNTSEVSDLSFENLIVINTKSGSLFRCYSGYDNTESTCNVSNVQIGCYMFDSNSSFVFNEHIKRTIWESCSFNIRGKTLDGCKLSSSGSGYNKTTYTNCHIHVDITSDVANCIVITNTTLDTSYITGKIETSYSGLKCGINGGILKNVYVAVTMVDSNHLWSNVGCTGVTTSTTSFIDGELSEDSFEFTSSGNLHVLTTAQSKDYEYLLSIGFPVIPLV